MPDFFINSIAEAKKKKKKKKKKVKVLNCSVYFGNV